MSNYFAELELPPSASIQEVRTRWRELAAKHHPDRGGDPATFDRYRTAYTHALAAAQARDRRCPTCGGRGSLERTSGWTTHFQRCPTCRGTGLQEPP